MGSDGRLKCTVPINFRCNFVSDFTVGGHTVPKDPADPSKGVINVTCGTAKLVCDPGPRMSMWAQLFKDQTKASKYPYGGPDGQSDRYSAKSGGLTQGAAVEMFAPEVLIDFGET